LTFEIAGVKTGIAKEASPISRRDEACEKSR
jgi:hypothetical protein